MTETLSLLGGFVSSFESFSFFVCFEFRHSDFPHMLVSDFDIRIANLISRPNKHPET